MISGFIYHLIDNGVVVYVGQSKTESSAFTRASTHSAGGKVFDAMKLHPVFDADLCEVETNEIIRHNPKYNKVISCSKNFIKKQTAMDGIAKAIKAKSAINKLNGSIYYETRTINKIINMITNMC